MSQQGEQQVTDELIGLLELQVIEAKDLLSMDLNGKSDPFFVVTFGGKNIYKSEKHLKTLNPTFNETAKVLISKSEKNYPVILQVWDWDRATKNELIGSVNIDVQNYFQSAGFHEAILTLHTLKGKVAGTVHIRAGIRNKQEVEEQFWLGFAKHFDTDNNGRISRTEFGGLVASVHTDVTEKELDDLWHKAAGERPEISFEEVYKVLISEPRLSSALLGHDVNFMWHVYAESASIDEMGTKVFTKGLIDEAPDQGKKEQHKTILVHERTTGNLGEEKIPHYIYTSLRVMYSTASGRFAVEVSQVKKLLHHLSVSQGKKYDSKKSVHEIKPFIEFHNLNVEEIKDPLDSFQNFNEFFYRKLKPSARPISGKDNPSVAVSPADCRLNVFPTVEAATKLWIKGKEFNLKNLLHDFELERKFDNGSLVIARLAPQDYHRFHIPIDCTIGPSLQYDGALYTVNPIAIREAIDVYTENKRIRTILHSPVFGDVLYISVGATMVGSINLTSHEGQQVKKGDEHGYFAFGGSTVLLIFQKNTITFDQDLIVNSQKPLETLVAVGTSIGVATKM